MVRRQILKYERVQSVNLYVWCISSSIYAIEVRPDGQKLYVAAGGKILVRLICTVLQYSIHQRSYCMGSIVIAVNSKSRINQ